MKLFVFPFAGGSNQSFNYLEESLSEQKIEMEILEYPGRGNRVKSPLLDDIDSVVADAMDHLMLSILNEEYLIYGHSMGGLVGYAVCLKIQELGLPMPQKLIVSGSAAPSERADDEQVHLLDSEGFWEKVKDFGGLPEELLENAAFKIFSEPMLRADIRVADKYIYEGTQKLNIPIDVFYGSTEKLSKEKIFGWERESSLVTTKELEGNHFFIYEHSRFFAEYFGDFTKKTTT